ncbi:MAG: DeoR/GlpR transcriptional regulator [Lentisphaerae bacterium]|nr:DeoR/GlpR transcriptional regulator [Lentisphaerota bacterium]
MRVRAYRRHDQILDLLNEKRALDIGMIAKIFNISLATARRDFSILEQEGKLLRTFGGVKARTETSLVVRTFGEKQAAMNAAKISIAKAAAALVKPGMKVMLDSGTTAWTVSRQLKNIVPLTVITASLAVIEEIGAVEGITLFCAGGKFRPANLDFYGPQVESAFAQFAADIAFLGIDQLIPGRGGYATDQESAAVIRAMGQQAAKRVVLADHSKIDSAGLILALGSKDIDVVITDAGISAAQRRQLVKGPYKLIVAR